MSDWVSRFLAHAKRGGITEQSVKYYEKHCHLTRDRYGLDLESCSEDEFTAVLDELSKLSRSYYRQWVVFLRRVLKFLKRFDLLEVAVLPKSEDRATKIRSKVLSREEIERLIREAPDLQDRLLVELLYESGARLGEIYNLKIKDVGFDEYGAIIWLSGKSGTRKRRIYSAVPDLRRHLNEHPEKNDPNTRLFHYSHDRRSGKFHIWTLYNRIRALGNQILGKNIHPHMFRHTRATEDSKYFTDREMMLMMGWRKADQISIYSHLSMRDVEDKDLVLHGLKPKEEILKPITTIKKCPKCNEENAPIAIYCNKCGTTLTQGTGQQDTKDIVEQIIKNPEAFKLLRDAMVEIVGAKLAPIEQKGKEN
jgi:integrase/recombinase XerD